MAKKTVAQKIRAMTNEELVRARASMKLSELLKAITPLPWDVDRVCGTRILSPSSRHKVTPQHPEYVVAQCGIYVTPKGARQHINAEYLALAANMLPRMVDVLKSAATAFRNIAALEGRGEDWNPHPVLLQIEALLAKLEVGDE